MKKNSTVLALVAFLLLAAAPGEGLARDKTPTLRSLKEAVAANPKDPGAYYNLGLKYAEEGQTEKAAKAWQQAVSLNPDLVEAYLCLGQAREELEEPEAAASALKKALSLKPKDPEVRTLMGDFYNRQGMALVNRERAAEAVPLFQEAAKVSPDPIASQNNLGVAYFYAGRPDDAREAFREVLGQDPNNLQALHNLGVVYYSQGDLRSAYVQYFNLKNLNPEAAVELSYLPTMERRANYQPPERTVGLRPSPVMALGQRRSSYSTRSSW